MTALKSKIRLSDEDTDKAEEQCAEAIKRANAAESRLEEMER